MRRRLFMFYTLTLVAALVALLAINSMVVNWVLQFYQGQRAQQAQAQLTQVQSILEAWPAGADDWSGLDRLLSEENCGLLVRREHEEIYSSLEPMQKELYYHLVDGSGWPGREPLEVQEQWAHMVSWRSGEYTLVAMFQGQMPEMLGRQRPQSEATVLSLMLSGVVVIGVIVLLSLLITRYQVRQILRPVQALEAAARRVEAGDLSTPVGYEGRDEFAPVCTAFDHMQTHLLQEREKNAGYERARTDLVAGISHDLRTPLTSVKGYIKGMRDGVANTPEKQARYLDTAYRKACDMERLLQRLFYFSKLETGNLPLFPVSTDLGEFVRRFAAEAGEELEQSGGRVIFEAEPGRCVVQLDSEQMYRVLTNLKENALRYAGVRPLVLTLSVTRRDGTALLRFADNGGGVPPEQLPHLFEQFWRGDQARSSLGGEGSGLGLYIVQYIVKAHGGSIRAENHQGLVVEITLPCQEDT